MHNGTSTTSDRVQIQVFFFGVPNAFDVVLLNQIGPIVVCIAFYYSIVDGDGLVNIEVIAHDVCPIDVLLSLEPLVDVSPIEKLMRKKGVWES